MLYTVGNRGDACLGGISSAPKPVLSLSEEESTVSRTRTGARGVWPLGLLSAAALAALPASPALAAPTISVTLSASAHTAAVGGAVTYTAQASNLSAPALYQFWVESPSGHWTDQQNYSSRPTFTLTPSEAGGYVVAVDVMTAAEVAAGDWTEAATTTPAALYVDSGVAVSAPSGPFVKGQSATVTATATNLPNAQFQFWVESPAGTWTGGAYGSARTDTIPLSTAGTYRVVAYAKTPAAPGDAAGALESAVESWSVAAGPGSSVEYQGGKISTTNPVTLAANQPVAITIVNVDAGGNPIPILGTSPGIFQLPSLSGLAGTAEWEPVGGGLPMTTVTIPPAASSATVWLVASQAQVVTSLPPAVRILVVGEKRVTSELVDISISGIPNGAGTDTATWAASSDLGLYVEVTAADGSVLVDGKSVSFPLTVSAGGTASYSVSGIFASPQATTLTIDGVSGTLVFPPPSP